MLSKILLPEGSYDEQFILENPIPAQCRKCGEKFEDGIIIKVYDSVRQKVVEKICNEAIRAPQLENCRCFYCGGKLLPLDSVSYQNRQKTILEYLQNSDQNCQPALF